MTNNPVESPVSFEKFDTDHTAETRKRDHIELAFASRTPNIDTRFYYEPLFAAHPSVYAAASDTSLALRFLGKQQRVPMWVSSMTGGTAFARIINQNLARACGEFGMGMGLGSCRQLLFSDDFLPDFAVRPLIGYDLPLYANLGIAQLEQLIDTNEVYRIHDLLQKLEADGLFIHVNPMQEWLQPEGDRFKRSAAETIETILNKIDKPLIIKEVGQGMGYESLRYLLQLPLAGIEFAAAGGTNFAKLDKATREDYELYSAYSLYQSGNYLQSEKVWNNLVGTSDAFKKQTAQYFTANILLQKKDYANAKTVFEALSKAEPPTKYAEMAKVKLSGWK